MYRNIGKLNYIKYGVIAVKLINFYTNIILMLYAVNVVIFYLGNCEFYFTLFLL